MKKRLLHGVGMALLFASPIWRTIEKPPNYLNFAVSLVLGVLLLVPAFLRPRPHAASAANGAGRLIYSSPSPA